MIITDQSNTKTVYIFRSQVKLVEMKSVSQYHIYWMT